MSPSIYTVRIPLSPSHSVRVPLPPSGRRIPSTAGFVIPVDRLTKSCKDFYQAKSRANRAPENSSCADKAAAIPDPRTVYKNSQRGTLEHSSCADKAATFPNLKQEQSSR